jgi:hypothetical protein
LLQLRLRSNESRFDQVKISFYCPFWGNGGDGDGDGDVGGKGRRRSEASFDAKFDATEFLNVVGKCLNKKVLMKFVLRAFLI